MQRSLVVLLLMFISVLLIGLILLVALVWLDQRSQPDLLQRMNMTYAAAATKNPWPTDRPWATIRPPDTCGEYPLPPCGAIGAVTATPG